MRAAPILVLTAFAALAGQARADEAQPPEAAPPQVTAPPDTAPVPADDKPLDGRRRPGRQETFPDAVKQVNPGAVRAPPPEAFPQDHIPVPDR